jgi:hypothetical protein
MLDSRHDNLISEAGSFLSETMLFKGRDVDAIVHRRLFWTAVPEDRFFGGVHPEPFVVLQGKPGEGTSE